MPVGQVGRQTYMDNVVRYRTVTMTAAKRVVMTVCTLRGITIHRHRSREMRTAIQAELKAKATHTQPPGGEREGAREGGRED